MMPKTIFCVIQDNESLDEVRRLVDLCEASGSHLSIAIIGIAPPPPPGVVYVAPLDFWVDERRETESSITAKAGEAKALLQKAGISGDVSQHYLTEGAVSSLVGLRARYSDLAVVFPETDDNRAMRDAALKGLVFEGGIPFVLASKETPLALAPRSVLIAWNGTMEATRAVHVSLDILAKAEEVVVAMVDPQANEWESGEEPGFDIGSFLIRHGIRADIQRLAGGGKDASEVLMRCAGDHGVELIIMGAYGHSRLREYVFGGTTREMLERSRVPVLMMH